MTPVRYYEKNLLEEEVILQPSLEVEVGTVSNLV